MDKWETLLCQLLDLTNVFSLPPLVENAIPINNYNYIMYEDIKYNTCAILIICLTVSVTITNLIFLLGPSLIVFKVQESLEQVKDTVANFSVILAHSALFIFILIPSVFYDSITLWSSIIIFRSTNFSLYSILRFLFFLNSPS